MFPRKSFLSASCVSLVPVYHSLIWWMNSGPFFLTFAANSELGFPVLHRSPLCPPQQDLHSSSFPSCPLIPEHLTESAQSRQHHCKGACQNAEVQTSHGPLDSLGGARRIPRIISVCKAFLWIPLMKSITRCVPGSPSVPDSLLAGLEDLGEKTLPPWVFPTLRP